ncbi:MAG: lytic transglycosylase domain-containing protein [Pseudolabrys sp.]
MQTPQAAIAASARVLRNLVRQFGNLGLAAAAYNAGPRRIQDWLARKGKLPEETQHYVKTITGRPAENWKAAKAASSVQNVPRQAPCQEATGLIASNEPQRADVATRSRAMLPHVKAPAYRSAGVRAVPPS